MKNAELADEIDQYLERHSQVGPGFGAVDFLKKASAALRQPEMVFVLKAARELSAFIKHHDYPAVGSADFNELTRLADVQDTELRALSAAEAEGHHE